MRRPLAACSRALPSFALVPVLVILAAVPIEAQTSRREMLEAERAAKAQSLAPYRPGRLESGLLWVEESSILTRLFDPYEGAYIHFGGLTKGAGLGLGPGYRNWLFNEQALFETWLSGSLRNYWSARGALVFPKLAGGKLEVGGYGRLRYWPRERYYGIGPDSASGDRTSFLREGYEVMGEAALKPRRWLRIGGVTGFRTERIDSGKAPVYPSIEEVFDESRAPGLTRQPDYWWTSTYVDVDYRDQPGNTRSGGHFRFSYEDWRDQQNMGFSFRDLRVEALHAFPIFDKKRVFIARVIGQSLDSPGGDTVPFYMMPTLGGSTSLRGFREFRFRDKNIFMINGEYRFEAFSGLDMALFADWGDVGSTWNDIDFRDLKNDIGIGFRFNTYKSVVLRFDIARSKQEGVRFVTSWSGAF